MRRGVSLKYLSQSGRWPSGRPRLYFRFRGKKYPLPDAPENSPVFLERYTAVHRKLIGESPAQPVIKGSIAAAIQAYRGSMEFKSKANNTKSVRSRALDDFRSKYGKGQIDDLRPRHIKKDLYGFDVHPANSRLKAWRALCLWCYENGFIEINPALDVKMRTPPQTDGHTSWSRDDFTKYRNYWPLDTKQRLAFEIMYLTCAAIGDACRIGPGNVQDGWITYRRQKSKSEATCPFTAPAPEWSQPDGMLIQALDLRTEKHLTWMVTNFGSARSPKAAASWFSNSCTKAGLPELAGHGIRKGRAAMFKENGAALDQRLAWLGQETEAEGRHYSKAADLRRVIESGTKSANPAQPSANFSG